MYATSYSQHKKEEEIKDIISGVINKKNQVKKHHSECLNCLINFGEFHFSLLVLHEPKSGKNNLFLNLESPNISSPLFFYNTPSNEVIDIMEKANIYQNYLVNAEKIKGELEIMKNYDYNKKNKLLLFNYLKFPLVNINWEENFNRKSTIIIIDDGKLDGMSNYSINSYYTYTRNYTLLFDIHNLKAAEYLFSIKDIEGCKEIKLKFNGNIHGHKLFKDDSICYLSADLIIKSIKKRMNKYNGFNDKQIKDHLYGKYFFTKLNDNSTNNIGILFSFKKRKNLENKKLDVTTENYLINKIYFGVDLVMNTNDYIETKDTSQSSTKMSIQNEDCYNNAYNENPFSKKYIPIIKGNMGQINYKNKFNNIRKPNSNSNSKFDNVYYPSNLNYNDNSKFNNSLINSKNKEESVSNINSLYKENNGMKNYTSNYSNSKSIFLESNKNFIKEIFLKYREDNSISNYTILKKKIDIKMNIDKEIFEKIKLKYFFECFKDINCLSLNIPFITTKGKLIINEFNPTLSSMRLILKVDKNIAKNLKKNSKNNFEIKIIKEDIIKIEYEEIKPPHERDLLYSKMEEIDQILGDNKLYNRHVLLEKSYFCVLWNITDNNVTNSSFLAYYSFGYELIGIIITKLNSFQWLSSYSYDVNNFKDFTIDYNENINKLNNFFKNLALSKEDGYYQNFYSNDYIHYIQSNSKLNI